MSYTTTTRISFDREDMPLWSLPAMNEHYISQVDLKTGTRCLKSGSTPDPNTVKRLLDLLYVGR